MNDLLRVMILTRFMTNFLWKVYQNVANFAVNIMMQVELVSLSVSDQLPSLNLKDHCSTPVSSQYPKLLRCPSIQEGIKECQRRGKKVLISIGGPTGDGTLPTPAKARELAHTLFNLFLGGSDYSANIRPFGE